MLRLPPGIEIEDDTIEMRQRRLTRGLSHRFNNLYNALYEEFGDDVLDVIRRVSGEYGRSVAERARDREEVWDLDKVGRFIIRVFDGMNPEGEVTEFNDERVVIEIHKCPYPNMYPEVCRAHITMEEELVRGLNPGIEFRLEKARPREEGPCVYTIRKADNDE